MRVRLCSCFELGSQRSGLRMLRSESRSLRSESRSARFESRSARFESRSALSESRPVRSESRSRRSESRFRRSESRSLRSESRSVQSESRPVRSESRISPIRIQIGPTRVETAPIRVEIAAIRFQIAAIRTPTMSGKREPTKTKFGSVLVIRTAHQWLCHADARQVFDLPSASGLIAVLDRNPKGTRLVSHRLTAHRHGRAITRRLSEPGKAAFGHPSRYSKTNLPT